MQARTLALLLCVLVANAHAKTTTSPNKGQQGTRNKEALQDKIKHVIILMEENRSYDHLLGFYKGPNPSNGLTGNESNLVNPSDSNSKRVTVSRNAQFVAPCDPNHGLPATTDKIYGVKGNTSGYPGMVGFVDQSHAFTGVAGGFHGHTQSAELFGKGFA